MRRKGCGGCKTALSAVKYHCPEELGDCLTLLLKDLIAVAAALPVVPHKVPAFSIARSVAAPPFDLSASSEEARDMPVMRNGAAMLGQPFD